MGYNFIKNLTLVNRDVRSSRNISYIVIHYTGNKTDKAVSNSNYFKAVNRGSSAHYFVDESDVYQIVEDKDIAWAVGKNYGTNNLFGAVTNANSISIEMCSTNGAIANGTFNNTVELTKNLMKKYGIPASNVYTHYQVCSKRCPGWEGWIPPNTSIWDKFKTALVTNTSTPKSAKETFGEDYKYIFNYKFYADNNTDLKKLYGYDEGKLWNHYLTYGIKEDRLSSAVFNCSYYRNHYTDLQKAFGDDNIAYCKHFLSNGMKEGRRACYGFNVIAYKRRYKDLQKSFGNDLKKYYAHWINYGFNEKRIGRY